MVWIRGFSSPTGAFRRHWRRLGSGSRHNVSAIRKRLRLGSVGDPVTIDDIANLNKIVVHIVADEVQDRLLFEFGHAQQVVE
jgi:hypothetical protein